jgi:two-component system response regulator HydG
MEEKASILIVDDNISLCKSMSFILRRKGYAVATAKDGPEAIARARRKPYDIVFIDMKMPTVNGLETYLAIKENNAEVKAIMMTAYRQEMGDLVENALKNSAYTCLDKPLDMEEVFKIIEEILERKRSQR